MSTKQHGELVRPGDEFNREPWYQCGQCGSVHGRQLAECDGLRKPFRKPAAMTTDPKMPGPVRKVSAAPPFAVFDEFGKGCDDEVADHVRAYAEALAAARVAQERERCARVCEHEICACCWDDDAQAAAEHLADAIRKQPPETGKERA